MMSDKPLIIIARDKRQADAYAYSNGIAEYIHASNADHLRGLERGLDYAWVPEFSYMVDDRRYLEISKILVAREHKPVR